MATSIRTFTVAAPLPAVESFLADPTGAAEWDVTVASIVAADEPAAWDLVVAFYGKRIAFAFTRGASVPGRLVEYTGRHASARMTERFELASCPDGGTSVTYVAEIRLTGALRLLNKGLDSAFAAVKAKSATRLALALESLPATR